jgi:hypothetical protein
MDTSLLVQKSGVEETRVVSVKKRELEPIEERDGSESGTKYTFGSTPFIYSTSFNNDILEGAEQQRGHKHTRTTSINVDNRVEE